MVGRESETLDAVEALVELSRVDWMHADSYFERAEALLAAVCTRETFMGLRAERDSIARLAADLRRALERAQWEEAKKLARSGIDIREEVARHKRLLEAAIPIYSARRLDAGPTMLALTGATTESVVALQTELSSISKTLRTLVREDADHRELYLSRAEHFESLRIVTEAEPIARVDPEDTRTHLLEAADAADFNKALRLAEEAERGRIDAAGRIRAPRPTSEHVARLAAPLPPHAVESAARMGFALHSLEPDPALNDYLSCGCAECVRFPESPLTEDHRTPDVCTCGHACPPQVRSSLQNNLDLLLVHPFVSSGGARYLPWFGRETILVESFPEDQLDPKSDLLEAFHLAQRVDVSRLEIENALLTHGMRVCRELGLDPIEFTVVCIPFDVYLRLAPTQGWGQRQLWTHFDGYQVTKDLKLLALVGGDVRFGGPDDLCSLARDYRADRVIARFAIVRRGRFMAREPDEHAESES